MIHLILPCGSNFGWGICGKYLVKELCDLCEAALITENFDTGSIGDELEYHFLKSKLDHRKKEIQTIGNETQKVDHPVLQAITDETLQPWLTNLKGTYTAGYTFFEMNVLQPQSVQAGINNFDVIVIKLAGIYDTIIKFVSTRRNQYNSFAKLIIQSFRNTTKR